MVEEKYYEVTIESDGRIPREAFKEVHEFLQAINQKEAQFLNSLFTWSDENSHWSKWEIKGSSEWRGKWTTRYEKYRKEIDRPIQPEILAMIGEKLKAHVNLQSTTCFEIAKYSDWLHGAFEGRKSLDGGTPGKCWWTEEDSIATRKGMIKNHAGYSILFYKDRQHYEKYSKEQGIGRCWLLEINDGLLIFNAYGISLVQVAQVLKKVFDLPFHRVNVISEFAFINAGMRDNEGRGGGRDGSGRGILLSHASLVSSITLPDMRLMDSKCFLCHQGTLKSAERMVEEKIVCKKCIKTLPTCKKCGNRMIDAGLSVNYLGRAVRICNSCADYANDCNFCGKTLHFTHKVWHTGYSVCDNCIDSGHACNCHTCGRLIDRFVPVRMGINTYFLCPTDARRLKERLP